MNPHTASTSSIARLLDALMVARVKAEWTHTGGGCYAVEVPMPVGYLLVTDHEGPFDEGDLNSDEQRHGWFVGRYDADGSPYGAGDDDYLYASHVDTADYTGPHDDLVEVVAAIIGAVVGGTVRERQGV